MNPPPGLGAGFPQPVLRGASLVAVHELCPGRIANTIHVLWSYAHMWECQSCNYLNEDLDEQCARCAAGRISSELADSRSEEELPVDATQVVAVIKPAASAVPAPAAQTALRSKPKAERGALAFVLIGLVILAGLLYYAWWIGRLDPAIYWTYGVLHLEPPGGFPPADTSATAETAEPALDPLDTILEARIRGIKPLRKVAEQLYARRNELNTLHTQVAFTLASGSVQLPLQNTDPTASDKGEQAPSIDSVLQQLGERMLLEYGEFRLMASRAEAVELQDSVQILRDEWEAQFSQWLGIAGDLYAIDPSGQSPLYLLPDRIVAECTQDAPQAAERLKQRWSDAVNARQQHQLDEQLSDEYLQLQARIAAVDEVRDQFNAAAASLPEYHIRAGVLPQAAMQYLELLEKLLATMEALSLDSEQFEQTLDSALTSEKLEQYQKSLLQKLQEQHLFAFTEIYRLYAQDEALAHPVYQNLAGHMGFVQQHWPRAEGAYRSVYTKYEQEWASRWNK